MREHGALEVIEGVIRSLGFSGTYSGMNSLIIAVALVWQDPSMLHAVTKVLYPEVAKRCGGNGKNVERNLRTASKACWDWGNRELLNKIAGFELKAKPTTGELIDYIVHYLRVERMLDQYEGDLIFK